MTEWLYQIRIVVTSSLSTDLRSLWSSATAKEVEKVAKFLSNQSVPEYDETITEEPENSNEFDINGFKTNNNQHDELYDQAVALIAREGRASTSFIQRHFKIGYNRAATIIEKMEENNVVSKPGRAGKREVLIGDH